MHGQLASFANALMHACMDWTLLMRAVWKRGSFPAAQENALDPSHASYVHNLVSPTPFPLALMPFAYSCARKLGTPQDICRVLGVPLCQQDAELCMTPAGDL